MRLRRCVACKRWTLVSRDLAWALRALPGVQVTCRIGRGCRRETERIETRDWL